MPQPHNTWPAPAPPSLVSLGSLEPCCRPSGEHLDGGQGHGAKPGDPAPEKARGPAMGEQGNLGQSPGNAHQGPQLGEHQGDQNRHPPREASSAGCPRQPGGWSCSGQTTSRSRWCSSPLPSPG